MKKVIALLLAGMVLFSVFFLSPKPSRAETDECFDEYETCRTRALGTNVGVIKTTLMLTLCDLSLGTCLIANAL